MFLSFCFFGNAQTWEDDMIIARKMVDSFKNELKNAKGDKRIDNLNLLVDTYFWIWDDNDNDNDKHLDSACMYSDQAYELAKNSTYKRGLGYAILGKANCFGGRVDDNINNNNSEPNYVEANKWAQKAIQIGEEIKDYRLIGDVYNMLKWMERWKGSLVKFKDYVEKAISYYEKPITKKLTGLRNISTCDQCKGNEGQLAGLYPLLATIAMVEDNAAQAKECIDKAVHYYTILGRKAALGNMYMQFAETVTQAIDLEAGIIPFKKAIEQFHESGNAKGEFDAHMRICRNYWNAGDFENGFSYSKKGIVLAKELSKGKPEKENDYRLGEAYYWMSRYYLIAGDFESALSYIKKTEPFYQDEFKKMVWATAIGGVYRSMGNIDSAKYYLLPFGIKPPESLGRHVGNIEPSRLYIHLKEYDKAIASLNQLIKIDRERNIYISLGGELTVLSKAYLGKNENVAALNAAREGLSAIKRSKRNAVLIENYELLSDIFYKLGNSDSAYIYLKLYMALKDSLLKKQYLFRLNNYKKEAEEERTTSQINLLNKNNQLKEQKLKQQAFVKNGLTIGIFLLSLLGVFIFRSLLLKRKNEKLRMQQDFELKQLENEKKQAELEMQPLRAQMNPHFIFNCLSSINRFILKNESKTASNYLTRFSRLIRMVLINSQKPMIALEDELQMLRLYLDMERLRFKDSFNYRIAFLNTMDGDNIFIPPLLLQPFCENAIWHGLMHKEGQGMLDIELSMQENILNCTITDNGIGRGKAEDMNSKSTEKEKSMGLKITTERLALLNREKGVNTFYEIEDVADENGNAAGTKINLKISYKDSVEELIQN